MFLKSSKLFDASTRAGFKLSVVLKWFFPINLKHPIMKKLQEYESYAEIYKVLANGKRLAILNALSEKELSVSVLIKKLHFSKTNISQHLTVLRHARLVQIRKESTRVYYHIVDLEILDSCRIIERFSKTRARR
jgi:ArsR family transcriptional regulator